MTDRREFIKQSAALGLLTAIGRRALDVFNDPPEVKGLLMTALNSAKGAGASYADVRIARWRTNAVFTREHQILNVVDTDTVGCGVRVLVDGTWGFAATRDLSTDGVADAAKKAVATARALRIARDQPVELAPTPAYGEVTWSSAFTTDPFDIPVEQKVDVLLKANTEALTVPDVKFVNSGLQFVKEERHFASTEGSTITQTVVRCGPTMNITAVSSDHSDFQSRTNVVPPMAKGWEYVLSTDLPGHAQKWAEEAAEKLKAKPVEVGRYDLVLHPSTLWLPLHESIGHPTELDRA